MSKSQEEPYPRPDFKRTDLIWQSLNGPWDLVFDDEDVGLNAEWPRLGLPAAIGTNETKITQSKSQDALRTDLKKYEIQVPFVFQTAASGINNQDAHEFLWYERTINDIRAPGQIQHGHRLLLRFGAVDYEAKIWVNGKDAGFHRGGHVPFDVDITNFIKPNQSENKLILRVRDSPHDLTQPRGKQYWKPQPESIFYTPSSGVWQTVWLESVPAIRIADSSHGTVLRSNDIVAGVLHAKVAVLGEQKTEGLVIEVTADLEGVIASCERLDFPDDTDNINIDLPMWLKGDQLKSISGRLAPNSNPSAWRIKDNTHLALWSPEYPSLYNITIKIFDSSDNVLDEIHTTTGMRSISWDHEDQTFRLNDKAYFQALVLDQGYWPKTNMTPPSPDSLKLDIELSKAMGFNGCRKHQKVEDPLFLYWADRLGYLVWGEMANAYEFSSTYIERFDAEWKEAIQRDINHPCVVAWTPANESWGYTDLGGSKDQRNHLRSLYSTTKALDPTRPINDNCGWEHVITDLVTFHEYADAPRLRDICKSKETIINDKKGGRDILVRPISHDAGCKPPDTAPILCTEFGGVNIAPVEGQQSGEGDWGYTTASDPEDLLKRVEALAMAVVDSGVCCGFVYTQLTDIEQEVNGLYTFDRRAKLDVDKVKDIMNKAKARYFELLKKRTAHQG